MLHEKLAAAGFEVERMPRGEVDNLWAQFGDVPKLLFAGHVDVVPPGDVNQWQSDPFCAVECDGFIVGRGAADMKSGVAAMTAAALRAVANDYADGLALLFTSDEEGAALDGTAHVVRQLQKRGVRIKRCIVGEPTCEKHFGDRIKTGRRGSLTADITITGVQCHAAYPQRGKNPIPILNAVLAECIEAFGSFADGGGQFQPTTFQIVKLQSGIADNVIPPMARAVVNFRYAPQTTAEQLQNSMQRILQNHAPEKWQCQWQHSAAPFVTAEDAPLIKALAKIINDIAAPPQMPQTSTGGGTSDGRFLRHICDELAEFGPLNTSIHEVNEKVKSADVRLLTDIYTATAKHFLNTNG